MRAAKNGRKPGRLIANIQNSVCRVDKVKMMAYIDINIWVHDDIIPGGIMKAVTIRGVEPEVAEKLKMVAKKQGKSVNRVILELIKTGLGVKKEKKFSRKYDDLDDLFGRWDDDEFKKINDAITTQRQIDPELWK